MNPLVTAPAARRGRDMARPDAGGLLVKVLIIVGLLMILVCAGCIGVMFWGLNKAFPKTPLAFTETTFTAEESERIESRLAGLRGDIEAWEPEARVVLSQGDMNWLLQEGMGDVTRQGGMTRMDLEDGRMRFRLTIPMPDEMPMMGGRHMNLDVSGVPEVRAGDLLLKDVKGRFGAIDMADQNEMSVIAQLRSANTTDPDMLKAFRRVEDLIAALDGVTVEDGNLVITADRDSLLEALKSFEEEDDGDSEGEGPVDDEGSDAEDGDMEDDAGGTDDGD